ncbi:MAG TPA: zinc-binding dehydrogenase [Rhodanobacteraceae bacterium]|nr:zinc-binding dehydrogenase [Rhodanobacteraceae bacterium]
MIDRTAMRAAVMRGGGRVDLERAPQPRPDANEVRVRLRGCGVCASNLPVWAGRPWFEYPLPPGHPGHEGWGEIAALGEGVEGFEIGEPVALLSAHAYAEYDVAPAEAVARIPARFANLPLPGEPLACAMNILRRARIDRDQWVAIVGVGFIGALLVQLASSAGARVIALSRRPFALQVARDCGAGHALATDDMHAAIGAVREQTRGAGCACVIEAAGEQATLDVASALTTEGGRLVIAGYHQDGLRTVDMQQWNWRGLDVINAHERDARVQARGLREAMAALETGRLDPSPLLTHRLPLRQLGSAFELMQARPDGFLKAVVTT